ncbi:MAG: hypothetical protein QG604_588 [Candidatus Dependentiae bacterium]|nr:hypothetical protein [Candidatus Dependentiae bacterium]
MKWQKMNSIMLVASFCAIAGSAFTRAPLRQEARESHEVRAENRVNAIMNNMMLSAEHKEKLLKIEWANIQKLGLTATPVGQTLKAYLSLAMVQVESSRKYVASPAMHTDEARFASVSLDGDTESYDDDSETESADDIEVPASVEDAATYGKKIIESAQKYSDRLSCPGIPTVSQHRLFSCALFAQKAAQKATLHKQLQEAIAVHQDIEKERLDQNGGLARFIAKFKDHIQKKYGSNVDGLENEVMFKVFQGLIGVTIDPSLTIAKKIGDFLKTYNTYVQEKSRLTAEQLAVPLAQWAHVIVGSDKELGAKFKLLLVSFSMEEMKQDLKREPLVKKLKEALDVQIKQAGELLKKDGISFEGDAALEPMSVAMRCSEVVQEKFEKSHGQLTPDDKEAIDKYIGIADQISYLTNDYDIVVRDMAGVEALQRLQADIAKMSASEQELLKQSSAIEKADLDTLVPGLGTEQSRHVADAMEDSSLMEGEADDMYPQEEVAHKPRIAAPNKKIMLLIAIGVIIAGALLIKKFSPNSFAWLGGLKDKFIGGKKPFAA